MAAAAVVRLACGRPLVCACVLAKYEFNPRLGRAIKFPRPPSPPACCSPPRRAPSASRAASHRRPTGDFKWPPPGRAGWPVGATNHLATSQLSCAARCDNLRTLAPSITSRGASSIRPTRSAAGASRMSCAHEAPACCRNAAAVAPPAASLLRLGFGGAAPVGSRLRERRRQTKRAAGRPFHQSGPNERKLRNPATRAGAPGEVCALEFRASAPRGRP